MIDIIAIIFWLIENCSLPEDVVIINSTSSQLTYICNCPTSMIVKTAVCVGNGTWLPQVSCGGDDCTVGTESEGTESEGTLCS